MTTPPAEQCAQCGKSVWTVPMKGAEGEKIALEYGSVHDVCLLTERKGQVVGLREKAFTPHVCDVDHICPDSHAKDTCSVCHRAYCIESDCGKQECGCRKAGMR